MISKIVSLSIQAKGFGDHQKPSTKSSALSPMNSAHILEKISGHLILLLNTYRPKVFMIGKFSNLCQLLNYNQISKVSNHLTFVGLTPVGSQHFQAFWMPKCTGFQGHRRQSTGQNLIRPLEVVVHRIGKFSNLRQLLNIDPISNFSKQLTSIGLAQLGIQHFLAFFSILCRFLRS